MSYSTPGRSQNSVLETHWLSEMGDSLRQWDWIAEKLNPQVTCSECYPFFDATLGTTSGKLTAFVMTPGLPVTETAPLRMKPARHDRRERFLNGASNALLAFGLRDAKMDEIAAQLGVSKVILYRHFASKEDLIHGVLEREANRMVGVDDLPYRGVRQRAREILGIARQDPASFLLLVRDARNDPIFGMHYTRVQDTLTGRLARDYRREVVGDALASLSGHSLTNLILDSTAYWIANQPETSDAQFIDWYAVTVETLCTTFKTLSPPS